MIAKHSELLFIWDAKMTNPNGDMLNDNAPRFDETDRKAIVRAMLELKEQLEMIYKIEKIKLFL